MTDFLSKLKIVFAFIRLFRSPNDTNAVFKISEALRSRKNASSVAAVERAMADTGFKSLYDSKYIVGTIDLNELSRLPVDTLGYAFSRHLMDRKLDVNFYRNVELKQPADYWALRMRQNHDIWHVLTGFDTSVTGEIGLQAFSVAQTESVLSVLLVAGGLIGTVTKRPSELLDVFDSLQRGYSLGRKCRYLLGIKLDTLWNSNLQNLRADFGLITKESIRSENYQSI